MEIVSVTGNRGAKLELKSRIVGGLVVAWAAIGTSGEARAEGPAVEALNGRVGAAYEWSELDEQRFVFGPGATATTPAVEQHEVGPFGLITFPISQRIGMRTGVGARYVNLDSDFFGSDDGGSVELTTAVFVRDPDHYEVGGALEYGYVDISSEGVHGLRGVLQGKLFFGEGLDGSWPAADVELSGSIGTVDLEEAGDDDRLIQSVAGGLRVYPVDRVALLVGGRYEHLDVREGWRVETAVGRVELDVLVLRKPGLTLSPRFEGGNVDTELISVPHFRRSFYSAGIHVTLSFPGAESLVALNRNYY